MSRWTRWQDWVNVVLGIYLVLVPLFTVDGGGSAPTAVVMGAVIGVVALWALAQPGSPAAEYTQMVAAAVLFVAPWVFGYSGLTGAAANAWTVAVLVAALAGAAVPAANRANAAVAGREPTVSHNGCDDDARRASPDEGSNECPLSTVRTMSSSWTSGTPRTVSIPTGSRR